MLYIYTLYKYCSCVSTHICVFDPQAVTFAVCASQHIELDRTADWGAIPPLSLIHTSPPLLHLHPLHPPQVLPPACLSSVVRRYETANLIKSKNLSFTE